MTVGKQNLLAEKDGRGASPEERSIAKCMGIIFYEIEKNAILFFTGTPWDSDKSDEFVFTLAGI